VEVGGRRIIFLDTPGHKAFTAMRARGAQVTDMAVLVVAANDGVMPQTLEAMDHARNAGVPILVAVNKTDLPDANPDRVKQQLAEHGLVPEDWGGQTVCVPLSALTGQGISDLCEMILLMAEMEDLWADPEGEFIGVVVESRLDAARGPLATVLVRNGSLSVADAVLAGTSAGKVRQMVDPHGKSRKTAVAGTAVEVVGLSKVPDAGELVEKRASLREARAEADERQLATKKRRGARPAQVALEKLLGQIEAGEVEDLNLIIKGDVWGSVEALRQSLEGLNEHYEGVRVRVIHTGVGEISETDVLLARASNAIVVGFHVGVDATTLREAEQSSVQLRYYDVIYEAIDDISAAMAGLLPPTLIERELGHAQVRATFRASKLGVIAGCLVTDGVMRRGTLIRVLREGEQVFQGRLDSLRHLKEDRTELEAGFECGINVQGFDAWKEGDIIEAYVVEEKRAVPVTTSGLAT
jgi:translation initiation factor IF-2